MLPACTCWMQAVLAHCAEGNAFCLRASVLDRGLVVIHSFFYPQFFYPQFFLSTVFSQLCICCVVTMSCSAVLPVSGRGFEGGVLLRSQKSCQHQKWCCLTFLSFLFIGCWAGQNPIAQLYWMVCVLLGPSPVLPLVVPWHNLGTC